MSALRARCPSWRATAVSLALIAPARIAAAEVGASLTIASEERYRGRSLSEGRPVATFDLAYDDARGPYAGLSLAGVDTRYDGAQPLLAAEYLGYALRTGSGPTLDLGVINRNYSRYTLFGQKQDVQVYAGLMANHFAAHVFYAPNYYQLGGPAIYAEVQTHLNLPAKLRLSARLGVLAPPGAARARGIPRAQYDTHLALTREFGRLTLGAAWSTVGPTRDYYDGSARGRTGVTFSVSRSF